MTGVLVIPMSGPMSGASARLAAGIAVTPADGSASVSCQRAGPGWSITRSASSPDFPDRGSDKMIVWSSARE